VRTLKLVLAYEGTAFVGWQRQAEGVSVQSLIEDALARIEGRGVTVTGAGRTDAGVHALGQVASCNLEHDLPAEDLRRALNAMLPPEVRVTAVEEAAEGFHARYSAKGKVYAYAVVNGDAVSPFLQRYAWQISQALDVAAMDAAARLLEGAHDFAAFQSAGSSARTTTRTIYSSRVAERPVDSGLGPILRAADPDARLILYEVFGDGFLRHMVRALAGSLVEVGLGRRDPAWFAGLLQARSRGASGPTAPARGLWLARVAY
jgi:tRNA pseudouridine38-40 synthase